MSKPFSWFFLLLTVALNASAGLLLKISTGREGLARLLTTGGSLCCYGLGFIAFYTSLRSLPVSTAYPAMTGGAILAIVLAAAPLLGEGLTTSKLFGAILVVAGEVFLLRPSTLSH
jgi:multidrug transporter EmrE-like cation transporter